MAAARPRAHLDRLPDELLLEVIKQPCLSARDLISLARTNRRHYDITISAVYKAHINDEFGLAIYWAIANNRYTTLERLIENGIEVDLLDQYGYLLDMSVVPGDLRSKYDWLGQFPHYSSFSPLALAAYHGRDSMVKLLLDNGARLHQESIRLCDCCNSLLHCLLTLPNRPRFWDLDDPLWLDRAEASWWTPLHYAICRGHVSTAKLLLERGDSDDLGGGVSALHVATRWEVEEIIDYLLNSDLVDINEQTRDGVTALHVAYVGGRHDLVNEYLDRGANIDLKCADYLLGPTRWWTIFAMACADGDFDRALQYLRRGADPNFAIEDVDDDDVWTAMRFIYQSQSNVCPSHIRCGDPRIELEKEIIAAGRKETTSDT